MDLEAVMTAIGDRVDTIAGLRAYGFPPDSLMPPAAFVDYPDELTYDTTYGRGRDRLRLPLVVIVGKVSDRSTVERLSAYCNGSGAASIKAVVQAGPYTEFDAVRVMDAEFDVWQVAGSHYMGALFMLDIVGKGT